MKTILQALLAAINLYSEYFLGLIISIIIARNLANEEYGLYSSTIWLAGLFTIAVNSGLSITVTKFIAEFKNKSEAELSAVLAFLHRAKNNRQLLVLAITALFLVVKYGDTKIHFWLLVLLFICSIMKADYIFRMSVYKGIQRFDVLAKTGLIVNPINLAGVVVCVMWAPSLENFILVYCFTCLVYGLTSWSFNKNMPPARENPSLLVPHLGRLKSQIFSATLIVFLAALIFRQSQVVVLEQSDFLAAAGYFNIAFLLASAAITLIPGVYQEVLLPKITKAVADNNVTTQVGQAERYLLALSLLVAVPVGIYAQVIIELLYGERYLAAAFPLQLMMLYKAASILTQGANLTLISKDRQVSVAKFNVLLLIIAIILSVIVVPLWGLNGSLVVYGILVLCHFIGYQYLARQVGYKMLSVGISSRIVLSALIAALPVFLLNQYVDGVIGTLLGSLLFAVVYVNLLFILRGFDSSMCYLLKQLHPKMPSFTSAYILWAIKQLTP